MSKFLSRGISVGLLSIVAMGTSVAGITNAASSGEPVGGEVNGWMTANNYTTSDDITYMKSRFIVPKNPIQSNYQTIFLFPAILPNDYSAIMQPVLTYAVNNGDAVRYGDNVGPWALGGFYLSSKSPTGKDMDMSPGMTARPGDKIYASSFRNGTKDSKGHDQWTMYINNETLKKHIIWKFYVGEKHFNSAFPATLEGYHVTNCAQLPGSPFTVNDFHTYNSKGKEMAPGSYSSFQKDSACKSTLIQNTANRWTTIITKITR